MTSNEVIYYIKHNKNLAQLWSEFTRQEKEAVIKKMEDQKPIDLEKVLVEVKTGQNRLF